MLEGLIHGKTRTTTSGDSVFYSGRTLSNVDYHHGQLALARGVHNIQVMRASREHPETADGFGWTYNHAPNMVWWNDTFYVQYLSDAVGEHIPPGQTLIAGSQDGYHWGKPRVAFPPYPIPDGTTKEGEDAVADGITAVMHQRMGFYVSREKRLLMLGYYGISLHRRDGPNDGNGIGRVVREIYPDGTMGPIYFIRYNQAHRSIAGLYPFYEESKDEGFVKACREILGNPLLTQQWNEESDRDDPIIPQPAEYKALSYYHLHDGRVVGLWKHALFEINTDGGKTWNNVREAPGFVTKNAKIWGQATGDGKYVTVYNPSEFRWPLALSVSADGMEYTNLLLVNGEITTMRYGGNYKSYGPQYVRGIQEMNGNPGDGMLWVTYSMNKEDIWVSRIPVPIVDKETVDLDEEFIEESPGSVPEGWNVFSPLWAPVRVETRNGIRYLSLRDKDPFDYAKAERLFPESTGGSVEFTLMAAQHDHGTLQVELQNGRGLPALRMVLEPDGNLTVKDGYRMAQVMPYEPDRPYAFRITFDVPGRVFSLYVDGNLMISRRFFAPVQSLERITFRTGAIRRFPDADTPTDQDFDVPDPGKIDREAAYFIQSVTTNNMR
ncbi:MAG: hypothetical protein ACWGNV_06550 [Bacteroidales bacterium]